MKVSLRIGVTMEATNRHERAEIVRKFLAIMSASGNPGAKRIFGTSVRQLVGQHSEHYWSTSWTNPNTGLPREFIVTDDGRHAWGDELSHSDRPRSSVNEISTDSLRKLLGSILERDSLSWDDPTAPWYSAYSAPQDAPRTEEPRELAISPLRDLHRREIRYGLLMGLRVLFLLVGGLLVVAEVPAYQVWAIVCIGAAMVLPWVAVMVANERNRRHKVAP